MKKLKDKTFYTIFLIFSSFLFITFVAVNSIYYIRVQEGVNKNLNKIVEPRDDSFSFKDDYKNKIFLDYNIYTIVMDKENNVKEIISHSDVSSSLQIGKIAKGILNKNISDGLYVGNLYFTNYSYILSNGNYLIIMDNSSICNRLDTLFFASLIVFIGLEIVVFSFSKIITTWITKPAIESYAKQKEFIADASHELKTPLSIIMVNTDAALENPKEKKWLYNIKNETEKMNDLITNLLNLSKLESDIPKIYDENDLSLIVEKACLMLDPLAYENNVSIKCDIIKNLKFKCDSLEINQLVTILVDNAIKHSIKNKDILVKLYEDKNNIVLEVQNFGDQLKQEDLIRIFDRFYKIDKSRNRDSSRYGLGLAIAKRIVLNHNGTIEAIQDKKVTTFKVVFKK